MGKNRQNRRTLILLRILVQKSSTNQFLCYYFLKPFGKKIKYSPFRTRQPPPPSNDFVFRKTGEVYRVGHFSQIPDFLVSWANFGP